MAENVGAMANLDELLEQTVAQRDVEQRIVYDNKKKERCAYLGLIPSPDRYYGRSESFSNDLDLTKTSNDYVEVLSCLKGMGFATRAREMSGEVGQGLHVYSASQRIAFEEEAIMIADDAFRCTIVITGPGNPQVFLFYYAGHGLARYNIGAIPKEDRILPTELQKTSKADPIELEGGEWILHKNGFVGPKTMFAFWEKKLNDASVDGVTIKKKHLVIISDSCFSGHWVKALDNLDESQKKLFKHNPVIVQSSAGCHEPAHGGVFTPAWLALQVKDFRDGEQAQDTCFACWAMLTCNGDTTQYKDTKQQMTNSEETDSSDDEKNIFQNPSFGQYPENYLQRDEARDIYTLAVATSDDVTIKLRFFTANSFHEWNVKHEMNQNEPVPYRNNMEDSLKMMKNESEALNKTRKRLKNNRKKAGLYACPAADGDTTFIKGRIKKVLVDGGRCASFIKSWKLLFQHDQAITDIIVTHHDQDHTEGVILYLKYLAETPEAKHPFLTVWMNTISHFKDAIKYYKRGIVAEKDILQLCKTLEITVNPLMAGTSIYDPLFEIKCISPDPTIKGKKIVDYVENQDAILNYKSNKKKLGNSSKPGVTMKPAPKPTPKTEKINYKPLTLANVLAIALMVESKKTNERFLLTADARIDDFRGEFTSSVSYKYADVPHHGSKNNVSKDKVIKAETVVISTNGEDRIVGSKERKKNIPFPHKETFKQFNANEFIVFYDKAAAVCEGYGDDFKVKSKGVDDKNDTDLEVEQVVFIPFTNE